MGNCLYHAARRALRIVQCRRHVVDRTTGHARIQQRLDPYVSGPHLEEWLQHIDERLAMRDARGVVLEARVDSPLRMAHDLAQRRELPIITHRSTLFCKFQQTDAVELKHQNLYTYQDEPLLRFFILMQFRRITGFKTQHRWLENHQEMATWLGLATIPWRWTLSRRYKQLAGVVMAFTAFVAQQAADLDERFRVTHLVADKSLFKAAGPDWQQSDRREGRIPKKLRRLDTDATWSKSAYHGWVYGYGLHVTCTEAAFPILLQVETAACAAGTVLDQKAAVILQQLCPTCLAADDGYTKALRIRYWAKQQTRCRSLNTGATLDERAFCRRVSPLPAGGSQSRTIAPPQNQRRTAL